MTASVGVYFAHAHLQVLAEDNGIDLLHIKGPAVDDSLLEVSPASDANPDATERVARRSIDADVLVRPAHVARLFDAMHAHGWTTLYDFADGSAFGHAATMCHMQLASADVHRWFPGIGLDPATAFERLWADRHTVQIAGTPCWVPSVTAQRLILIIHAARSGSLAHPDIERSWTLGTSEERAEVLRLAEEINADVALAAGTGRLDQYEGARGYDLWRALSTREKSYVRIWVARVKAESTPVAALRTGLRLMLPKPGRMEATMGRQPTAREVAGAYAARARWGARELTAVARTRGRHLWKKK